MSTPVRLDLITVGPDRLRALRPDVVEQLVDSLRVGPLQHPITLQANGKTGYRLIAGHHRLEAARSLRWETIPATVLEGIDANQARLAEIDENLIRADLSPAERALHVDARKELYETLFPQTKHGGAPGAGKGRGKQSSQVESFVSDAAAKTGKGKSTVARDAKRGKEGRNWLRDVAGTALDTGAEIDALVEMPDKERATLIKEVLNGRKVSAKTKLKQIKRDARELNLSERILALPDRKFGVVLEDFEWDFETHSEAGRSRHADNHYPVAIDAHAAEEIVARTKERFECAAKDCVLFMWTTVPHAAIAMDVLRLRGFTYKSQSFWDKEIPATGFWFINVHEILLVGVRGDVPAPAPGTQMQSIIREKKREHSRKPEASYLMIETLFPNVPKIELNCRGPARPGWTAWGYEASEPAPASTARKTPNRNPQPAVPKPQPVVPDETIRLIHRTRGLMVEIAHACGISKQAVASWRRVPPSRMQMVEKILQSRRPAG